MTRALAAALVLAGAVSCLGATPARAQTDFAVYGFHNVVDEPRELGPDTVTLRTLATFFDWLRVHDYRVITIDDVLAAQRGERPLPPRAVLLTFDDGDRSFYTRVLPLIRAFRYPVTLALVGGWIEPPLDPTGGLRLGGSSLVVPPGRFLNWEEVREIQRSGLVEIASHTYGLHGTIEANPAGSALPAAVTHAWDPRRRSERLVGIPAVAQGPFGALSALLAAPYTQYLGLAGRLVGVALDYRYDPRARRYETDEEYAARVRDDLARNSALIEARVGVRPRVIVWPYGRYNEVGAQVAREVGMPLGFSLAPEPADARQSQLGRYYPGENPTLASLTGPLIFHREPPLFRGLCVTLDDADGPNAVEREQRLGRVIDRAAALQPSAVVLGALTAPDAAGRRAAYFPNDTLPVRYDLFGRTTWQLRTRSGVEVFADLPLRAAGLHDAMAKTVPFGGMVVGGETALAASLPPGMHAAKAWDPRAPREARAAVDRARLDPRAREALGAVDATQRYQPKVKVLETVPLDQLRPPTDVALNALDYLAVRWDGPVETAVEQLRRQGWLAAPAVRTLVYATARGDVATWRQIAAAGFLHRLYCPARLPEAAALDALRPYLSAADYPYVRR